MQLDVCVNKTVRVCVSTVDQNLNLQCITSCVCLRPQCWDGKLIGLYGTVSSPVGQISYSHTMSPVSARANGPPDQTPSAGVGLRLP
jgi:hypothetical protein